MAIERKVDTVSKVTKAAAPKKPTAKKPAASAGRAPGSVSQLRVELAEARRQHALDKLESPATLKQLRRKLARALTRQRQGLVGQTVERAGRKEAS